MLDRTCSVTLHLISINEIQTGQIKEREIRISTKRCIDLSLLPIQVDDMFIIITLFGGRT